jgi:hypothetical protein
MILFSHFALNDLTRVAYGVTKDMHVDAFGQEFPHGSQVVIGRYFNQQGRNLYSYVQCDKSEAYIFSHLIRALKF